MTETTTETTEPTATPEPTEPTVRDLSDAELREVQRHAVANVREVRAKVRTGKATTRDLVEGREVVADGIAARDELGRRIAERGERSIVERIGRRRAPLTLAREYDGELLDGVTLDAGKVTDEELTELRSLLRHRRDAARRGEAWPEAERERAEAIVGKSAGEPELYARRRDEVRRADEMRAEATKLARVFLPRRRDPEPGSVELPALLWSWLTNGRADTFDVTDLGVLAALAYSFANESAELFPRGTFVRDEQGVGIALGKLTSGQPRLARGADDAERLNLGDRLARLKANRWLELERDRGGRLTIRPGERMRKLWPKARG